MKDILTSGKPRGGWGINNSPEMKIVGAVLFEIFLFPFPLMGYFFFQFND